MKLRDHPKVHTAGLGLSADGNEILGGFPANSIFEHAEFVAIVPADGFQTVSIICEGNRTARLIVDSAELAQQLCDLFNSVGSRRTIEQLFDLDIDFKLRAISLEAS